MAMWKVRPILKRIDQFAAATRRNCRLKKLFWLIFTDFGDDNAGLRSFLNLALSIAKTPCLCRVSGKDQAEGRSIAQLALHRNEAVMFLNDPLRDGQSQAGAFRFG